MNLRSAPLSSGLGYLLWRRVLLGKKALVVGGIGELCQICLISCCWGWDEQGNRQP